MSVKALLMALVMSTVVLAGCTDNAGTDSDEEGPDLTKGGISGLLVDDNFRPVQLKEEWPGSPGDYQDIGFILLVQTAERIETTENGEFEVTGLDPGKYTLKVAAANHEAIEKTVDVVAGELASVTLEARRKVNTANPVVTIEFSGFVPCSTGGVVSSTSNCVLDLSGDAYRPGPSIDYRKPYGTDVHYMVIEAVASQAGNYVLVFREDNINPGGGLEFARTEAADPKNPYMKLILENSAVYGTLGEKPLEHEAAAHQNWYVPEHNPRFKGQNDGSIRCVDGQEQDYDPDVRHDPLDYCSWPNAFPAEDGSEVYNPIEALVFFIDDEDLPDAPGHGVEEPNPATGNPVACKDGCGAGYAIGIKINYVMSLFIGDPTPSDSSPEDDLNEYCLLCKGYLDETG